MSRTALLFFPLALLAADTSVEVRNSQIWLVRGSESKQLTSDSKEKSNAVLSNSGKLIAYQECPGAKGCERAVVIIDASGKTVRRIPAATGGCADLAEWHGDETLVAQCHMNPSLEEYVEWNAVTGATKRELLGYWFTPSPDGRTIAHVGWNPHFADPSAKSNYLQFDDETVYPLPKGFNPKAAENGLPKAPPVVKKHGSTYFGIHEFMPHLGWSPDSGRVALIDCIYSWTVAAGGAKEQGNASAKQCSLAVVGRSIEPIVLPINEVPTAELQSATVEWKTPGRIAVQAASGVKTFELKESR